jgi:hypothetical protein
MLKGCHKEEKLQEFLISNFRHVMKLVYFLLGISPASDEVLFFKFKFFIKPLKLDLTEGSETSAKLNLTLKKIHKLQESINGSGLPLDQACQTEGHPRAI